MKLVLIRHAAAEDRGSAERDWDRRLTAQGARRMRAAARGLKILVPHITHIAASPTVRTQQTARIIAETYSFADVQNLAALAPGSRRSAFLTWLGRLPADAVLVAVGHEPDLGGLASWLLARCRESFIPLKKGGACLIEFSAKPVAGSGLLTWFFVPAMLRRLGR